MPANSNSTGNLEIASLSLPTLNDRLRRIGLLLASGTTSGAETTQAAGAVSQIVLTVPGILAVESNVCPLLELAASQSFTTMVALVKIAPIGSPLTVQLFVGGAAWGGPLSIPGGAVSASLDVSAAGAIAANAIIRLDITAVGAVLTGVSFPGSDLTILLR